MVGLLAGTLTDNMHFQLVMRAGFRLRSALTQAIFRKLLSLSPTARAGFSSGARGGGLGGGWCGGRLTPVNCRAC